MRRLGILGSTGSIGRQALDVVSARPDLFTVQSLAAHSDVDTLAVQIERFDPRLIAVIDPDAAARLRERFGSRRILDGAQALEELAGDADTDVVLNAVVGSAGLGATLAALDAGRHVALANKESCVAGGPLVRRRLAAGSATLVPVDSEHAAAHMCLAGEDPDGVSRLILTASGGPFRGRGAAELATVSVADALAHPTWSMGPKISVDSATLMNKGLEVIEANVLFDLPFDRIEVVCHPQSVVHCLVGFVDGSWKASMSPPDMRVPIAYALGYPQRPDWGAGGVSWQEMTALTFEPVDAGTFRCLRLAYEAGRLAGTAPAVLNAANEVAVEAFLGGTLTFLDIADVVEQSLEDGDEGYGRADVELEDVLRADAVSRTRAVAAVAALESANRR